MELSSIDPLQGDVLWTHEFERNSKVDVVQNRFVTVVEPKGRCSIVALKDGKMVGDQPIKKNLMINEVHLLAGTDSWVLAVQEPFPVNKTRRVSGFNVSEFTRKEFAGQVYVFDRDTGLAKWDRPAEVEGLPLMLSQAVDLPVIAFAGNIRRRDRHGAKQEIGIMLLEKSSGPMLFHDETLPPSPHYFNFQVSEDDPSEAFVQMNTRKIRLKFTDRPRDPEPPARRNTEGRGSPENSGLQKIGKKIFGGG
jgi:hypothetical protein